MCGIYFLISNGVIDINRCFNDFNKIKHRGPDNSNFIYFTYKNYNIVMGFHRLKINSSLDEDNQPFYNDDIYIELKSRRNTYQKYNTTIIGSNKIDYVKTLNKKCYYVFCYLDGLYYIEYSNIFDSFDLCEEYIYRDGKKELKTNYHIPIECLKRINVTVSIQSIRFDV